MTAKQVHRDTLAKPDGWWFISTQKNSNKEYLTPFVIFSDGACSGNPGPGGWAAVIAEQVGIGSNAEIKVKITELGGHSESTTNNRMEMLAAIEALRFIRNKPGAVSVFTDSTYIIYGITQWVWGWAKNGWKTSGGTEVQNRDLWELLFSLHLSRKKRDKIEWIYSRGHVGTPGNERCDEIAVAFSRGEHPKLFRGSLLRYSVAIYDFPEDTSLPSLKKPSVKVPAYSYLSCCGGIVYRHPDWTSCERRVKGVSGARFKKATSEADEKNILKEWGISPEEKIRS